MGLGCVFCVSFLCMNRLSVFVFFVDIFLCPFLFLRGICKGKLWRWVYLVGEEAIKWAVQVGV